MVETHIVEGPLPPLRPDDEQTEVGAELVFQGRVRAEEHGRTIVALDYEVYPEMAAPELQRVAEEAATRFPIRQLRCWHRVGRVPVGEAALRVVILSRHRAEALESMAWFVSQLKSRVPIWKWALTEDGERFPSHCSHDTNDKNGPE